MESVIAALVSVALILFATLTVSQGTLSTTSALSDSWKTMEQRSGEIARTEILVSSVSVLLSGARVDATVANDGSVHLSDFDEWDVVLQYYDAAGGYYIRRMSYTSNGSPGGNEWTVEGIYLDAGTSTPEVYEPDIFNPSEELVMTMSPSPSVGSGTANQLVAGTPNGVTSSIIFTY